MISPERLVRTLGGPRVVRERTATYSAVADRVRAGLPYAALESLATQYEIPQEAVVRLLHLPIRTLARRKKEGRLRPGESDRLLRLAHIVATAEDVLEDRAKAVSWLKRPNRALGGARPLDVLDTDVGAREVERVLGRIEHGVYS